MHYVSELLTIIAACVLVASIVEALVLSWRTTDNLHHGAIQKGPVAEVALAAAASTAATDR